MKNELQWNQTLNSNKMKKKEDSALDWALDDDNEIVTIKPKYIYVDEDKEEFGDKEYIEKILSKAEMADFVVLKIYVENFKIKMEDITDKVSFTTTAYLDD